MRWSQVPKSLVLMVASAVSSLGVASAQSGNENWSPGFSSPAFPPTQGTSVFARDGQNGLVLSLCIDGPGPNGTTLPSAIQRWRGTHWEVVPAPCVGITDLAVSRFGSKYVVANNTNTVQIWENGQWNPLQAGPANGNVLTIEADELGRYYVGGSFTVINGESANFVARLDGEVVETLEDLGGVIEGTNSSVSSMVYDGSLVIGGSFSSAGGAAANRIAEWSVGNPGSWDGLDGGVAGATPPLIATGAGQIWGSGTFFLSSQSQVAYYDSDDEEWKSPGTAAPVPAAIGLHVTGGGRVLASADFSGFGDPNTARLAEWSELTQTWISPPGLGDAYDPQDASGTGQIFSNLNDIFFSSEHDPITDPRSVFHRGFTRFDGANWHGLGQGIGDWMGSGGGDDSSYVHAVRYFGGDLFVGGRFSNAGDQPVESLVRRVNSEWEIPGEGLQDTSASPNGQSNINDFEVHNGQLYAGGCFDASGASPLDNVARWTGAGWVDVSGGVEAAISFCGFGAWESFGVFDLHSWNGALYAGGSFGFVGGGFNGLHQLSGGTWQTVAGGPADGVRVLADLGSNLYVAGDFASAGEHIQRWNGSSWAGLSGGVTGAVFSTRINALAVLDGDIYAGGLFTGAGGVAASNLARWTGSTWQAVGGGVNGEVHSLYADGDNLIVGGAFTQAGGTSAEGVAVWDGSTWQAYGYGFRRESFPGGPGFPYDIVREEGQLWFGGAFDWAGDKVSSDIAVYQQVLVFADDFESGDLGGWTGSSP